MVSDELKKNRTPVSSLVEYTITGEGRMSVPVDLSLCSTLEAAKECAINWALSYAKTFTGIELLKREKGSRWVKVPYSAVERKNVFVPKGRY